MAAKGSNQKSRVANPMLTKNGNARLGPLNITQLNKLLETTQRVKVKAKITREILRKEKIKEKLNGVSV
jgi:hypothetical protein